MVKKHIFILMILAVLMCNFNSYAAWQDRTMGVNDREFYSIDASSGNIYLGTSGGLYLLEEKDDVWNPVFSCRGEVRGVAYVASLSDGIVYIATGNGLYYSNNSGKDWNRIFHGIDEENYCTYVVCKNSRTIYLGTMKGLFWTNDGGETWRKPLGMLGGSIIKSIAVSKNSIFVIGNNEAFKASLDFSDYSKVFGSESFDRLEIGEIGEENLEDEGLFLMKDIAASKDTVYIATNKGLFFSEDDGVTWSIFNMAGLITRSIKYVIPKKIEEYSILLGTEKGVYGYYGDRNYWDALYEGMDSADVRALSISSSGNVWAISNDRAYVIDLNAKNMFTDNQTIMNNFTNEPTVNKTMEMAIMYAEVYPEKIKRWRQGARFKAILPKVNVGIDHSWSDTYEIYTSSSSQYWMYGPQDKSEGWDVTLTWDLGDLIWNEAQTSIDVRSKLMVQLRDDIVDEITRTFFERRRLQIELITYPPKDRRVFLQKQLRIQELTASLDGLTGGGFSGNITKSSKL